MFFRTSCHQLVFFLTPGLAKKHEHASHFQQPLMKVLRTFTFVFFNRDHEMLDNVPTVGCLSNNVVFSPACSFRLIDRILPEIFSAGCEGVIENFSSGTLSWHRNPMFRIIPDYPEHQTGRIL
jgi:hypothetical protein